MLAITTLESKEKSDDSRIGNNVVMRDGRTAVDTKVVVNTGVDVTTSREDDISTTDLFKLSTVDINNDVPVEINGDDENEKVECIEVVKLDVKITSSDDSRDNDVVRAVARDVARDVVVTALLVAIDVDTKDVCSADVNGVKNDSSIITVVLILMTGNISEGVGVEKTVTLRLGVSDTNVFMRDLDGEGTVRIRVGKETLLSSLDSTKNIEDDDVIKDVVVLNRMDGVTLGVCTRSDALKLAEVKLAEVKLVEVNLAEGTVGDGL